MVVAFAAAAFHFSRAVADSPPVSLGFGASLPQAVRTTADGREVVVEFLSQVTDEDARAAVAALGDKAEGYTVGHSAVRIRLAAPVRASLAGAGASRRVEIAPLPATPGVSDPELRRLRVAEAQRYARRGEWAPARLKLTEARRDAPADLDVLLALAGVDAASGRWRDGLAGFDRALQLYPDATDVLREREALSRRFGPSIRLTPSAVFGPGGERDALLTAQADAPIAPGWRIGVIVTAARFQVRNLRRSRQETPADFNGTKVRADLGLAYEWGEAGTTRADLLAAPRTLGAAVNHRVETRLGETTLSAAYQRPYWGTIMSFDANARRDDLAVGHAVTLGAGWTVAASAGLVRYGIPSRANVAAGADISAGVTKALPLPWLPVEGWQLQVGYRLDAQYLSGADTAPSRSGPLPLLDIRSREVHSGLATLEGPVGPGVLTIGGGYGVDRFGGHGPSALVRYGSAADAQSPLLFGVEAAVEPALGIRSRPLYRFGGFGVWRFGHAGASQ